MRNAAGFHALAQSRGKPGESRCKNQITRTTTCSGRPHLSFRSPLPEIVDALLALRSSDRESVNGNLLLLLLGHCRCTSATA